MTRKSKLHAYCTGKKKPYLFGLYIILCSNYINLINVLTEPEETSLADAYPEYEWMNQVLSDNIKVNSPCLLHNLFSDDWCNLFFIKFCTTYYMIKKANISSISISDTSLMYNL